MPEIIDNSGTCDDTVKQPNCNECNDDCCTILEVLGIACEDLPDSGTSFLSFSKALCGGVIRTLEDNDVDWVTVRGGVDYTMSSDSPGGFVIQSNGTIYYKRLRNTLFVRIEEIDFTQTVSGADVTITLTTLPVGFRPTALYRHPIVLNRAADIASNEIMYGHLLIGTDGVMQIFIYDADGTSVATSTVYHMVTMA